MKEESDLNYKTKEVKNEKPSSLSTSVMTKKEGIPIVATRVRAKE